MDGEWTGGMRIHVVGPVGIRHAGGFIDAATLPGRQGRALLALLVTQRSRPMTRDLIAERLWGADLPEAWGSAVSALISKIRRMLESADPSGGATVSTAFRAHQLRLPADTWVDLEVARARIDAAEALLRGGEPDAAWADAHVAWTIADRDFLAGEDAEWVEQQRSELDEISVRALGCLADVWQERGEFMLAARCASAAIDRQPYREDAYRRLMSAQAAAGNRAEAVRTFRLLETKLSAELGVGPDPTTARHFEAIRRRS